MQLGRHPIRRGNGGGGHLRMPRLLWRTEEGAASPRQVAQAWRSHFKFPETYVFTLISFPVFGLLTVFLFSGSSRRSSAAVNTRKLTTLAHLNVHTPFFVSISFSQHS